MTARLTEAALDHVALVTDDLERSFRIYARLGFNLSPQSSHQGRLEPGGPVELWGAGNHCAMFASGYLEILGVTDARRYCEHVRDMLKRYTGLHLIALSSTDIALQADRLKDNLGAASEPYEVSRDVPQADDDTRTATFRILQIPEQTFPEADLFYIEHRNRDVLWQPALLAQPNGVVALAEAIVCSDDCEDTAGRLGRALDLAPRKADGAVTFDFARSAISIMSPASYADRFEGAKPPQLPSVAAARFVVEELESTMLFLEKNGFERHRLGERAVWIDGAEADGAVLIFSQR